MPAEERGKERAIGRAPSPAAPTSGGTCAPLRGGIFPGGVEQAAIRHLPELVGGERLHPPVQTGTGGGRSGSHPSAPATGQGPWRGRHRSPAPPAGAACRSRPPCAARACELGDIGGVRGVEQQGTCDLSDRRGGHADAAPLLQERIPAEASAGELRLRPLTDRGPLGASPAISGLNAARWARRNWLSCFRWRVGRAVLPNRLAAQG